MHHHVRDSFQVLVLILCSRDMWKQWLEEIVAHKEGLLAFLPEMEAQIQPPPLCVSQYALVNHACAFIHTHPSLEDANYGQVYLLDQGDGHEEGNGHGQNYTQVRIEPHRSEDEHGHRNGSSHRHGHNNSGHGHGHEHEGGQNHGHGHEGGRNHRPGHGHRHEHEGGRNQRPRHEGEHNHRHEYQHRSRHEHGRGHNHRNEHGRGHNHRNEHGRGHNHRHEHENEHGSRHRHRHRRHGHHRASEDECCKWLTELDDICVCNLLVRLPPFLSRLQHKYSIRVGDTCKVSYQCEGRRL